jgi:hypothetical protein
VGDGSVTWSANLITSTDVPSAARIKHERGNVEQAKELGPIYLLAYVAGWALVPGIELGSVVTGNGLMEPHRAHPAEWNANYRMGLGNTWR